jgi:uncharacterized phage protein gp47/JayE
MRRWREIFEAARDFLLGAPGNQITNFNEGGVTRTLLETMARQVEVVEFRADSLYRSLFCTTAVGDDLELRAGELGISRKPARSAQGFVRFTGEAATVIPSGTRVSAGGGASDAPVVEFATSAEVSIPVGGEVDVEAVAVVAGATGNVAAGQVVTLVDSVPGVSAVTNPAPLAGGADAESDDDLRRRCTLAPYRKALGKPEAAWVSLAEDVVGVARARVVSCYDGPGTFKVLCWSRDADGLLVAAPEPMRDEVAAVLASYIVACVDLVVAEPSGPVQDIVAYVSAENFLTVAPLVRAALEAVFEESQADGLVHARLVAAAMGVAGVDDVRVAVPAGNVDVGEADVLEPGDVRVLPMEWDGQYL